MNNPTLRSIFAIVVSLIAAFALVILTEIVTLNLHPFPEGVDNREQKVINDHVATFPHGVLAIATVGWLLTAFVTTWIATRLGANRNPTHGHMVGTLLFLAAAYNMFILPYQLWFKIVNFIGIPIAVLIAVMLAKKKSEETAA